MRPTPIYAANLLSVFVVVFLGKCGVWAAGGGTSPPKGDYQVLDSNSHYPCLMLQADIYLYLTYNTNNGQKDGTVHVPTTSTVDKQVSSCKTTIGLGGLHVDAQLLRINLDHMPGWYMDLAFTKDDTFRTDKGKEFTMFSVNITANYSSYPSAFPDAAETTRVYYLPYDSNDLSVISESIYADVGHSYYCPSKQKYVVNKNDRSGPYAYIQFQLMYLQAFKTSFSPNFDQREVCPSDQHVTDFVPIIIGSVLAGLIVLTLVVYLIYRGCLDEETISLVNPESHFDNKALEADDGQPVYS